MALAAAGALAASFSCRPQRKLRQEDCAQAKEAIIRAWTADANAAVNAAERSDFRRFVKSEGDRIGDEWTRRCAAMIGRPVDAQQLSCLRKVRQIDDVYRCLPKRRE